MTVPSTQHQEPDTPCPDWCALHIDGEHVAELELVDTVEGHDIYIRPVDYGDGKVGLQVIVAVPNSKKTIPVDIDPEKVTLAALQSDLRRSLAAYEAGRPVTGGDDTTS